MSLDQEYREHLDLKFGPKLIKKSKTAEVGKNYETKVNKKTIHYLL